SWPSPRSAEQKIVRSILLLASALAHLGPEPFIPRLAAFPVQAATAMIELPLVLRNVQRRRPRMKSASANQLLRPRGQQYLLGHSKLEQQRLRRQAKELHQESAWLFDRLGLRSGGRALDLGCGPQGVLDLLAERVGPPDMCSASTETTSRL